MLPALQCPVPCSKQTQLGTAAARTVAKECADFVMLFLEMMLEAKIARYCMFSCASELPTFTVYSAVIT
jgi:hypothetical protein